MSVVERSAVTGGQDLLLISPVHTLSPGLLALTPGDLLAQPQELLRHLDILHTCEGVVTLPLQLYRHGIYQEKSFSSRIEFYDLTDGLQQDTKSVLIPGALQDIKAFLHFLRFLGIQILTELFDIVFLIGVYNEAKSSFERLRPVEFIFKLVDVGLVTNLASYDLLSEKPAQRKAKTIQPSSETISIIS